jgi:sugar phosphate isomerase/epimerase
MTAALTDFARLSINDATTQNWTLAEEIVGYAARGIRSISIWRDKLAACGRDRAVAMIADHGMRVSGLCRGGMFPRETAAERRAAIDDNLRAIDDAAALKAACLVLVVGGLPGSSKDIAGARAMVHDGLAAVLDHARKANVKLAIEPLHPMYAADRACVNTMRQANDLCDALGAGVGIACDVYHVWWDPELESEIHRAGRDRLFAFHICDWLVPTQHLLLDRGMMGDGVVDIRKIRGWVEATGYAGDYEVEIFSAENWWRRLPGEVIEVCKERYLSIV